MTQTPPLTLPSHLKDGWMQLMYGRMALYPVQTAPRDLRTPRNQLRQRKPLLVTGRGCHELAQNGDVGAAGCSLLRRREAICPGRQALSRGDQIVATTKTTALRAHAAKAHSSSSSGPDSAGWLPTAVSSGNTG